MAQTLADLESDLDSLYTYRRTLYADPKPNYSAPGGQSLSWGSPLAEINEAIPQTRIDIARHTPIEIHSEVVT